MTPAKKHSLPSNSGRQRPLLLTMLWLLLVSPECALVAGAADPALPFEIRVIDGETQRGIPLVELITVDDVRHITDNAGRIAYSEPGQVDEPIFFRIEAQGYEIPRDGFGIAGVRLHVQPGGSATIDLKRINRAERMYRITGRGGYRDTLLLDKSAPLDHPLGTGLVAGQDSVQLAPYRGKLYWFWGDTNRLAYPLGLFRTAGATTPLPRDANIPVSEGVNLTYFTGDNGFARAMVDVPNKEGVVWIDGVCTVPDQQGRERLVARFSRRAGLAEALEQGHLLYNDDREIFEVAETVPLDEEWRCLKDHPTLIQDGNQSSLMSGNPFPVTRAPATLKAILDRTQYESWSCTKVGDDPRTASPQRTESGALDWRWRQGPPTTQAMEARWLKAGLIKPSEARFLPVDVEHPKQHIEMHSGTVHWNPFRQRYIMIAVQNAFGVANAPSGLGEVWYAEAESPQGPYRQAVKIVTHNKQTFYNPCQHPCFDEADGRIIYFEGTYCNTFTHSPATQRYNYNQIMYRLDLGRLDLPVSESLSAP